MYLYKKILSFNELELHTSYTKGNDQCVPGQFVNKTGYYPTWMQTVGIQCLGAEHFHSSESDAHSAFGQCMQKKSEVNISDWYLVFIKSTKLPH